MIGQFCDRGEERTLHRAGGGETSNSYRREEPIFRSKRLIHGQVCGTCESEER